MMTSIDNEKSPRFITLEAAGEGAIQAGETQQERLEEFTNRVGYGEFHRSAVGTIPCKCIDGRTGGQGDLMPNTAGGSETLMVADDLTSKDFMLDGDRSTSAQYARTLEFLAQGGYSVGGHTAVELHGAPSGCGANDKLADIYGYISRNGDTLRGITTSVLGYDISDADHDLIIGNATDRTEFTTGDDLLATLRKTGGDECVDNLRGAHTEVMAVINRRAGTTLDRDAIEAEFGSQYEAFNIDEWAFENGAKLMARTDADTHQKRIAMAYYNFATAGVLCGPDMRVVVLD